MSEASEILARRAVGERFGVGRGASSFFSQPTLDFDSAVVDNATGNVRPDVRHWVLTKLYGFWAARYHAPHSWSTAWIAGSGLTHQWSAARAVGEPGDLDVLIGVDFSRFYAANPRFRGIPEDALAERFNDEFRARLDLDTAAANLNGTVYTVTFYVNPDSTDIRTIRPYAAYDLTHDGWTVRPPELPQDWHPENILPGGWFKAYALEAEQAAGIIGEVGRHVDELRQLHGGTAHRAAEQVNSATLLHDAARRAVDLFDSIHQDRHKAFGREGMGYADYYNVRWQAHKQDGTISALRHVKDLWNAAHQDATQRCYGGPLLDARHALTLASLVGGGAR